MLQLRTYGYFELFVPFEMVNHSLCFDPGGYGMLAPHVSTPYSCSIDDTLRIVKSYAFDARRSGFFKFY